MRSKTNWRAQIIFLELATTCLVQSEAVFFHVQAPVLLEALKPFLWSSESIEPTLQCMLRLLRGCYHAPQPVWSAGVDAIPTNGDDPKQEKDPVIHRYNTVMHPHEDTRATLILLAQLHATLFTGWGVFVGSSILERIEYATLHGPALLLRSVGLLQLKELPFASLLVEPLAEISVAIACHAVQWAVEQ